MKKTLVSSRPQSSVAGPRFLRLRDAPIYLGMNRNLFNSEVRPHLTEIPIGTQGIAFDRLDLDAWADQYKNRNGRPGRKGGNTLWDAKPCADSPAGEISGISTSRSEDKVAFAKALAQATGRKLNDI